MTNPARGDAVRRPEDRPPLTVKQAMSGEYDFRKERVTGTLVDVFDDETDAQFIFLSIRQDESEMLAAVCKHTDTLLYPMLCNSIGCEVALSGNSDSSIQKKGRRHLGRRFCVGNATDVVVNTAPPDLFDAPDFTALDNCRPAEIASAGRHRASGYVLAAWDNDKVLLALPSNRLMRLRLANAPLPKFGDRIEALGFPETDLYHIDLIRAVWRPAQGDWQPDGTVSDTSISKLYGGSEPRRPIFEKAFYGKTIRLRGFVVDKARNGILPIGDGRHIVQVEVSALGQSGENLLPGHQVEITAPCIVDIDYWRPHDPFPKIRGMMLVTRTKEDLRILARPPWWTIEKLLAVIAGLIAALLGIFVWNRILHKIAERRGRELFKEQIAHISANLRTAERTRLAIELHDSISQNLTGVSLEIKTALTSAKNDLPSALTHLAIAERSLTSCHTELRNCLWDLRNGTLEAIDMNEAIRQVLRPQVNNIDLKIRFNIPRRRLTDNTAYVILKIIRELAVNAVRHGKATVLKIAGALQDDKICFSVSDNGCGFDPKSIPGPEQGHFGLLGVTERIDSFEGEMTIDSAPGRGTHIAVVLKASTEKEIEQ